MPLVVDSSAIIALALSDEDATYANEVLVQMASQVAFSPRLFWYEVRNTLVVAERRNRIAPSASDRFLSRLGRLTISLDQSARESVVMDFARRHGLSVYDAAYLELADRFGGTLATLDSKLVAAAASESIDVLNI